MVLLPAPEPVNVNTASREVLAALFQNMDAATAEHLVQLRQQVPFASARAFAEQIPEYDVSLDQISVSTEFFEVRNRLRLSGRVVEQRTLVQRAANAAVNVISVARTTVADSSWIAGPTQ